jgi:hypothetical protein
MLATVIADQLEPKLITALVASAAAVVAMVFTLARVWTREALQTADSEDFSKLEPDVKASVLRVLVVVLLVFFSLGLIIIGIAASVGKASISDIWQMLEKAALAEALVVAYSGIGKKKIEGGARSQFWCHVGELSRELQELPQARRRIAYRPR